MTREEDARAADRASPRPVPGPGRLSDSHRPHSARWTGPPVSRRFRAALLAVPLLLAGASGAHPAAAAPHPLPPPQQRTSRPPVPVLAGGIQVNEPDETVWVESVRAAGLGSVQVTVYARQLAWDGAAMIFPEEAPAVVSEIRAAHAAGLDVVLVLRTALEHGMPVNRHLWHGMIWPRSGRVEAWFERYGEFALWGARLAAREDVELLAVASELNALTSTVEVDALPDLYDYLLDPRRTSQVRQRLVDCAATVTADDLRPDLAFRDGTRYPDLGSYLRAEEEATRAWTRRVVGVVPEPEPDAAASPRPEPDAEPEPAREAAAEPDLGLLNRRRREHERHWRRLIERVRQVYPGPVTYAANFDQVREVGFWDALDAIGVNAYYGLGLWGLEGAALEARIEESWRRIAGELQSLAAGAGGPAGAGPLPVVITELGWTAKAGATVRPWSYHRVEVLETAGRRPDGGTPLTCVHWATQPEAPVQRVRALRALLEVVRQGDFPALRGFQLWKLTTLPSHREIEPFAVVLPGPEAGLPSVPRRLPRQPGRGRADDLFLAVASRLAELLQRQAGHGTLGAANAILESGRGGRGGPPALAGASLPPDPFPRSDRCCDPPSSVSARRSW